MFGFTPGEIVTFSTDPTSGLIGFVIFDPSKDPLPLDQFDGLLIFTDSDQNQYEWNLVGLLVIAEPSDLALFGVGLVGLAWLRRRRAR